MSPQDITRVNKAIDAVTAINGDDICPLVQMKSPRTSAREVRENIWNSTTPIVVPTITDFAM